MLAVPTCVSCLPSPNCIKGHSADMYHVYVNILCGACTRTKSWKNASQDVPSSLSFYWHGRQRGSCCPGAALFGVSVWHPGSGWVWVMHFSHRRPGEETEFEVPSVLGSRVVVLPLATLLPLASHRSKSAMPFSSALSLRLL